MKLQYPHVCLDYGDYVQFTTIPIQKKNFYECPSKSAMRIGKRGFLVNNGTQTTIWASHWGADHNQIKIAFNLPSDTTKGWSDLMSFSEEDSVMKIYKMMKLRAFW